MCRLYGFIANTPTKVECSLLRAQNALFKQSRLDSRGAANHDGWGIAYYENGLPVVERRSAPAYEGSSFGKAAARAHARVVVAHVRAASVGGSSEANVHPFRLGRWVLAHNGTIPEFQKVRPFMEAGVDDDLLAQRRGETDSELLFLWILARLREESLSAIRSGVGLKLLVAAVRTAIERVDHWCRDLGVGDTPSLNLVMTDGRNLVASRRRNGLYWIARRDFRRCEDCDSCHCPDCAYDPRARHGPRAGYRAVVVASEPLSRESWEEMPEDHVLAVDERLRVDLLPIA